MFAINSYKTVGPIRFGMSADELTFVLGQPLAISNNRRDESSYRYDGFNVVLASDTQAVVEVGLLPELEVSIDGISVFRHADTFQRLIQLDRQPYEYVGFIVLLELGLTLTGFHDSDESQKAVTAFAEGRWDKLKTQLQPFRLNL